MPPKRQAKPSCGFVINDGKRFRLCRSERTERGPRRIPVADLGPATECRCRTISGAVLYWHEFRETARAECAAEREARPDGFRNRRQWQRALQRQRRAERRLTVLQPLLDAFAAVRSLVVPSDLDRLAILRSRKKCPPAVPGDIVPGETD